MTGIRIVQANELAYEKHDLPATEDMSDRQAPEWMRSLNPDLKDDERGPSAPVLKNRIISSCAGWPEKPSGPELHDAIHAKEPTARQRSLVRMWVKESQDWELMDGWMQGAYTMRELVAAMHRCGLTRDWGRNQYLAFYRAAKEEKK